MKAALCVVDDDPRLPKTRLHAKIPSIGVSVTEQKVLDALSLATSIPLPESDTAPMALNKVQLNKCVFVLYTYKYSMDLSALYIHRFIKFTGKFTSCI